MLANELFTLPFGGIEIDRDAPLRREPHRLAELWDCPESRLLVVDGQARVAISGNGGLAWQRCASSGPYEHDATIFIGRDASGRVLFAKVREEGDGEHQFVILRDVALGFDPIDQSAAALTVALATWHSRSKFCSRCGGATRFHGAGHLRFCPACDRDIFPRSDSAVIMLVRDGDRCVLGRRIGSAPNRWSTLAGFVEAGESPEAAVWREVHEEVGLRVDRVRYRGGQPWPFPNSLMLAYEAHAPWAQLTINEEHHEVRWFERSEVASAIAKGEIAVPSRLSAGGHLITAFVNETATA